MPGELRSRQYQRPMIMIAERATDLIRGLAGTRGRCSEERCAVAWQRDHSFR
jgi:hypothetical protein